MAIAMLWAPRNHLTAFLWIAGFARTFEVTVKGFCYFWIGLDLFFLVLGGFRMSTEMLHVVGAALGVAAGVWMLRKRLVDCEGWDYLSLRAKGPPRRDAPERPKGDPRVHALVQVRDALEAKDAVAADERYEIARRALPGFALPRSDLEELVGALRARGLPDRAVRRMEELLRRSPEGNEGTRLALAELLVGLGRRDAAREQLEALGAATLSDEQRALRARLEAELREERRGSSGLELE
jgi:hypothetical protein